MQQLRTHVKAEYKRAVLPGPKSMYIELSVNENAINAQHAHLGRLYESKLYIYDINFAHFTNLD